MININTKTKTRIDASHAGFSAMQYQSLKSGNIFRNQIQNQPQEILPFSDEIMNNNDNIINNNKQSVFVIDSHGTEEQQIDIETLGLPIIHEDEEKILKDLEIDSLLYSNSDNDIDMKSDKNEDLTIKIKSETNIFNPEIRHFEVTYPQRKSAEERASILIDRAFQSSPILSPELTRLSKDFINMNRNSSIQLGFGRDFTRLSQNLFAPISDDFRISDQYRYSQNSQEIIPPPYVSIHDNNGNYLEVVPISDDLLSQNSSSSHSSMTSIREKHRACTRCHKVKKKCVRSIPGGPCIACTKKGVYCESRQDGRKRNRGKTKKRN